jgi:hypothetical protein
VTNEPVRSVKNPPTQCWGLQLFTYHRADSDYSHIVGPLEKLQHTYFSSITLD